MITIPKSKSKAGKFQGSVVPNIKNGKFFHTKEDNERVMAWKPIKEKRK